MPELPAFDVLLPVERAGSRLEAAPDEVELMGLYNDRIPVHPPRGVHVRANMIGTIDGAATGADHVTGSINGSADWRVFRVLRALADVVLIGAGTARDERYSALEVPAGLEAVRARLGRAERIELAIVSASGAVPPDLLDAERPPIVITTFASPSLDALRERIGSERVIVAPGATPEQVDLGVALRTLGTRGLQHVLAEGGPRLLAELVAADLVDELCLTWSPRLVGGPAPRILNDERWLEPARETRPVHLLHSDGVLLGRWQVTRLGA
ncbi:dihydrofolate reductase family protein [Cellulomonas alba]|uniref:Dihydrofolate reductase family protein n=1 Tax=Cellulomonas alba TaxID=3053467 RepID=A0ABT7SBF2_9CELL|nr:dihydrofolate reductase family protein [Cellulomonas alba]MDM7853512.1 dihydrofolate reductase family protein [Cellulomonas alba]